MQIRRILTQRGPNLWSRTPVLEVELEPVDDSRADQLNVAAREVHRWLIEQQSTCAPFNAGTGRGELLRAVAIELQKLAGAKVPDSDLDVGAFQGATDCCIAVSYDEEFVGREAVSTAARMIAASMEHWAFDFPAELSKLKDLADQRCLGPSTRAIVEAAQKRGIPTVRLNRGSFVQLGYGAKQRRIRTAETDQTSAVAESICQDKDLTKRLLAAVGVPVPDGRPVSDRDDAWVAAEEIEVPVVVKPVDGNHGRGVFTGLLTKEQVQRAYDVAAMEGSGVLVEQFARGSEHRLLVVGGKVVAATGGEPAYIVGDGVGTVEQLVEQQLNSDPRRGEGYDTPLSIVELIDPVTLMVLEQQGHTTTSVPAVGQSILLQRNGNLAIDVTDRVHPNVATRAVDAARVVGLDIAGIDMVVEDISQPLEPQRGMIVEVNAGPGLQMHLSPMVGKPRPVGEAIVESLIPPGQQARIPIAAIYGGTHATIAAELLHRLLRPALQPVGLSSGAGLFVDGRRLPAIESKGALLMNPMIESAVFELQPAEIRSSGLPFDRCQVAVFLSDDRSAGALEANVHRLLAESLTDSGHVVMSVGSRHAEVVPRSVARVLVSNGPNADVDQHVRQGGAACLLIEDVVQLIAAGERHVLGSVTSDRMYQVDLCAYLSTIAAAWGLGAPIEQIQSALTPADS